MDYSPLVLSLWVSLIATSIIAVFGTLIGYVLARKRFLGRTMLDAFITLPMVLPPTVTGYYLIILLGKNGIIGNYIYKLAGWSVMFTWQAAVIAATVVAIPIMIKSAKAAIKSVGLEYEKAAFTLGKSEIETFFLVTLPLAIYRAFLSGEDQLATTLVILITTVSIAVIFITTRINRTD